MPTTIDVAGPQSIDIMMPKKRQQGFEPGALGGHSAAGVGPNASAASAMSSHSAHSSTATHANNFFGPFGTNGLPSSFIDTDILLNDDLWSQFSPATTNTSSNGADNAGREHLQLGLDGNADHESATDRALGDSYVNIPHTGSLDMFGLQARTFGSVRPVPDELSRLSKDASSMDDGDSPDGSNGETTSTVATSVISPSSMATTGGSLPKGTGTRHHRSTSNASSTHRSKTARSLSRSRTRAAPVASDRRTADRSPSLERSGVGKAPSSRARVSRRATVGPAALANGLQTSSTPHPPAPTRSASTMAAVGSGMGLSSSFQPQTQRWSLFGTPDANSGSNLHFSFNGASSWGTHEHPGTTSASSSLPTPLNFHTSMAHLNLQTPPVSAGMHNHTNRLEEDSSSKQPFNPFLFPPYTQARSHSVLTSADDSAHQPFAPQAHVSAEASGRSSETSEVSEAKPATKPRRPSKVASQASREKLAKEIKTESAKNELKNVSSEEPQQGDEDEDDDGDDDDEHLGGVAGGKSEAEAKRLAEKRRKRRESHNAVERRRRDNINEKITELATLLPEAMLLDAIATSTQGGNSGAFAPALAAKAALAAAAAAVAEGNTMQDSADGPTKLPKSSTEAYAAALAPVDANSAALAAAQAKPNKGIILRKSVEYIRHLQQFLDMQMGRISFLEAELARSHQALAASGMQAPPTTDPQQGLGMMHAFFNQADNGSGNGSGMFGDHTQQQQQQQASHLLGQQQSQHSQQMHQQPPQDFSAMNLLSLGMPMDQQSGVPQSQHQQSMSMHQSGLSIPHTSSSSHDAMGSAPALAAWLEGFDQRTGLPRRSSVDPIEEEEHQSGEEDKELSRRGRSQNSRAHDAHDEHWRGRPRHKMGRGGRAQVQEGSWPELQPCEAQSPMQLVSGDDAPPTSSFSDLGDMKLDL
ncbi:Retrograde regulation protein 3 [Pseudozyma hubeiensis]|nr:Retrograde regulation protein 3 [Pseudozyma hubeiensis]